MSRPAPDPAARPPGAPACALVMAITGDLGFAAGVTLASFLAHNPDFPGDIVLYHDGLPASDLAALQQIVPRLRAEPLSPLAICAHLGASGAASPPTITAACGQIHPYILAKFEMFDRLAEYQQLVWFDADLLIRAPLDHLWQGKAPLGWRPLPEGAYARRARRLARLRPLHHGDPPPLPNAGVVTLNAAALRAQGIDASTLYGLAAEALSVAGARTLDESALFLCAARYRLEVTPLALSDNHPVAQEGSDAARILHAIGPDKFWSATPLLHACPDWVAHHQLWCAAGGAPAPAPSLHGRVHPLAPAAALGFARNRGFWQGFWPDLAPQLPPGLWPELRPERGFLRLHLQGTPGALHLDIARGANDQQFHLSAGLARERIESADLLPRLERAMTGLDLTRHEGRRIFSFGCETNLEALPAEIARLTAALAQEFLA